MKLYIIKEVFALVTDRCNFVLFSIFFCTLVNIAFRFSSEHILLLVKICTALNVIINKNDPRRPSWLSRYV